MREVGCDAVAELLEMPIDSFGERLCVGRSVLVAVGCGEGVRTATWLGDGATVGGVDASLDQIGARRPEPEEDMPELSAGTMRNFTKSPHFADLDSTLVSYGTSMTDNPTGGHEANPRYRTTENETDDQVAISVGAVTIATLEHETDGISPHDSGVESNANEDHWVRPPVKTFAEKLALRQTMKRSAATWLLLSALVGGLSLRFAFANGPATIATAMAIVVFSAIMVSRCRVRRRVSIVMIAGAISLAIFLPLRTSPWLIPLNLVAIVLLLSGAASYNMSGNVWGPVSLLIRRLFSSAFRVVAGIDEAVTTVASIVPIPGNSDSESVTERRANIRSIARGTFISAPLLAVMATLFAGADPVFASYLRLPALSMGWLAELVIVGIGAIMVLGLFRLSHTIRADIALGKPIGNNELTTVLGGFVSLYVVFATLQIAAAVGGAKYVRERTGGSYKEYARSGFFQLLAASAITLVLLFIARGALRRTQARHQTVISVLSVVLCGLSVVVVASSIQRILLYSQEYGQTMLRVYSATFAVWLGGVFVLVGIAAVMRSKREWVGFVSLALAFVGLLGMNVFNPERYVAQHNLHRAMATGDLYTPYLAKLSAEAVPAIADGIAKLPITSREDVRRRVCDDLKANAAYRADGSSLWSHNVARQQAQVAVDRLCARNVSL
jgi:hypothetical protein